MLAKISKIAAVMMFVLCGCSDAAVSKKPGKLELIKLIYSLEPWRATKRYSEDGWKRAIQVARVVQQSDPKIVEEALRDFIQGNTQNFKGDYEEESKPFILLRVVFDLPDKAPLSERFSFKGWLRFNTENHSFDADKNPDGTVNLGWPVIWRANKPELASGCRGSQGVAYAAENEFKYMHTHFPPRNLEIVQFSEK